MKKYSKHIKFFVFVILAAVLLAFFEIQIEGANGWAANLPTWKINNVHIPFLGMWYGYRGKPLTGYHVYTSLLILVLLHTTFLYTKWNFKKELNLLSFYAFFTTIEGLLWFVFNPAWGWNKFKQGIPWYKEAWILGLPAEYWLRFGAASVLYYFSQKDADSKSKVD